MRGAWRIFAPVIRQIGGTPPTCFLPPINRIQATPGERPIVLSRITERTHQMFSAEQYRAKVAEYTALLASMPRSPNETSEFRNLEQTYTTLADNEEWMTINIGKTVRQRRN